MILQRKHVGCLDFKYQDIPWVTKTAAAITHMLAHDPESVRHGQFYTLMLHQDPQQPVSDAQLLTLGALILASGWPAVSLKRTQTDDEEKHDVVFVMLYFFPPSWTPDQYTYTPDVIGANPSNLKLDAENWTVFRGSALQIVPNPYRSRS